MPATGEHKKLFNSQQNLKRAWQTGQRSTKDDWIVWMRTLSIELLKESPARALRACSQLAVMYTPLAQDLFNAAFVSVCSRVSQVGYS